MLFSNISVFLDNGIKTGYHIGVKGENITYISDQFPKEDFGFVYDGSDKVLMPGFVNTHCHVAMTSLRGLGEDLPLERWLKDKIFPLEAIMTTHDAYWGSMLGICEMLRNGITSFTDMYFLSEPVAKAALESGIKCNFSHGCVAPDSQSLSENGELYKVQELCSKFQGEKLLKMDIALHAEYTTNPRAALEAAEFAGDNDLRVHIHMSETFSEHQECINRHNLTPAAYFESLGLFKNPVTAAHCVAVTDEDIEILRENHVNVSHCPASNLKLGSGIAPVSKMLKKGVFVSIGTDSAASNNSLDILRDARLCALLQKGINKDPSVISAGETLKMITSAGAYSQGRMDTGTIELGKKADLCVLNLKNKGLSACESDILYSSGSEDIVMTMVNGDVLYEDGEYKKLDFERILIKFKQIKEKFINNR